MPSFQDSAVIFFIALLLFGPKKLPELARYVGKLMGEFRRASSEFRLQMEDEFRISEQAEQQKKIAAMEAAAPIAPSFAEIAEPEHPHTQPQLAAEESQPENHIDAREPLPIASTGELNMMPPATGLPLAREPFASQSSDNQSLAPVFDAIPHAPDPQQKAEAQTHG